MRVGDALPALVRTLDLPRLVAYAGATWDWHRLHYDQQYASSMGLRAPIVDGQMFGALLAEQAEAIFPGEAFVRRMSFRFAAMVFAGETVRVEGEVVTVDGRSVTVRQRVVAGDRVAVDGATTEVQQIA